MGVGLHGLAGFEPDGGVGLVPDGGVDGLPAGGVVGLPDPEPADGPEPPGREPAGGFDPPDAPGGALRWALTATLNAIAITATVATVISFFIACLLRIDEAGCLAEQLPHPNLTES